MANILDKEGFARLLDLAIGNLVGDLGKNITEVEHQLADLLVVTPRTLQLWKKCSTTPASIQDEQLLGFISVMLMFQNKDLAWLIAVVTTTDIVFYDPPSPDLIQVYLRKARIRGGQLQDRDIETLLERLFGEQETNHRIIRLSTEWWTAMPVSIEQTVLGNEKTYYIYFDEEVRLDEYYVYFNDQYVEPAVLKLIGFDFERRKWKFKIFSNYNAHLHHVLKTGLWRLDYKLG